MKMVRKISSSQLKNRISEVVNDASYGGTTTIIEIYGKPLAKIVPYNEDATDTKYVLRDSSSGVGYLIEVDERIYKKIWRHAKSKKRTVNEVVTELAEKNISESDNLTTTEFWMWASENAVGGGPKDLSYNDEYLYGKNVR